MRDGCWRGSARCCAGRMIGAANLLHPFSALRVARTSTDGHTRHAFCTACSQVCAVLVSAGKGLLPARSVSKLACMHTTVGGCWKRPPARRTTTASEFGLHRTACTGHRARAGYTAVAPTARQFSDCTLHGRGVYGEPRCLGITLGLRLRSRCGMAYAKHGRASWRARHRGIGVWRGARHMHTHGYPGEVSTFRHSQVQRMP